MNREIKFRCWIKPYYKFDKCKKDYRMIYPHLEKDDWYVIDCQSQTLMDGEGGKISDYKMYLQQFTGLKDKNGKELFEGDIFNLGDKNINYVVEWIDCGFKGRQLSNKSTVGLEHWESNIEIIGNKYEN